MKIKQGGNIYPIITSDDVIVTNTENDIEQSGKTVTKALEDIDQTLNKYDRDIEKLKSNVKYIYSYGGVGGNGRGGSGGGGTTDPTLFVSLDGRQLLSGSDNLIILNKPDSYVFEGSVSNHGTETFYVDIKYGPKLNLSKSFVLNADNRWKIPSTSLKLSENGDIRVTFSDSDKPLSQISQKYVVFPHTLTSKFMYEYDNGSGNIQEMEFRNYEYFIGNASYRNPFIDVSFKIDLTNVTHVQVKFDIGDTEGTDNNISFDSVSENPITCGHGVVSFDTINITTNHLKIYLDNLIRNGIQFTDESNNGTYHVSITLSYTVNGKDEKDTQEFDITLIPNDLYIHVKNPQGLLFDTDDEIIEALSHLEEGEELAKSLPVGAYTSFTCKIFEGPLQDEPKYYYLEFNVYDYNGSSYVLNEGMYDYDPNVKEQVEMTNPFSVAFQTTGIKKLEFKTTGKKTEIHDNEKPAIKYIYVNEPKHKIDAWYPSTLELNDYYFKANIGTNIDSDYFSGLHPFETSETNRPITISGNWVAGNSNTTTIFSLGMQYSAVNSDGAKILEAYNSANVPVVSLYSNKLFDIGSSVGGKMICIPTEKNYNKSDNSKYHLIQIVRHLIGENTYGTYLYIDGKLESNKAQTDGNPLNIRKIVFNNVNAIYNLINIQYINLLPTSSIHNTSDKNQFTTIDELIYQYYLAYKDIMHVGTVTQDELDIYSLLPYVKFDGTNVLVEYDTVKNISKSSPIPTMMMDYALSGESADEEEIVIQKLFKGYQSKSNDFGEQKIYLYWADAHHEIDTPIVIPPITDNGEEYTAEWRVKLQGTSTMRNRIKNFSLVVSTNNSSDGRQVLMSPNFSSEDNTTFLPENIWTLKADIADSAHANNTAVGKFVNRTCTKFSTTNGLQRDDSIQDILPYIKNTLEGFPILMFFRIGSSIFYLGVYNFNMGRDSYFNLGYRSASDMLDMWNHIQSSGPFSYSIGRDVLPETMAVGEIQDNHAQYDFHQFHSSMLFGGPGTMFGSNDNITGADTAKARAKGTLSSFVRSVAKAGAYCFADIGKTPISSKYGAFPEDDILEPSNDCVLRYTYKERQDVQGKTYFEEYVPDARWQFVIDGNEKVWFDSTSESLDVPMEIRENSITFDSVKGKIDNLLQCISDTDAVGDSHSDWNHLDFTSLSEYYTICMTFGLVDSVLKNMNIKSWDGKKCYIAFYDMDCAMGEDNKGEEDVSYLAASDYWYSPVSNNYVEQVKIHYDYWPENDAKVGKGYDYPSSYLFAIAKYAQPLYFAALGRNLTRYPQQFWAELRSYNGELRTAEDFVKNYFSSGIGQIPAYLASLNYQVKYLYYGKKIDKDGNESAESTYLANAGAFNGTRLEKVKEWLDKRIHFLDFMFNIQGVSINIGGGYTMPKALPDTLSNAKLNTDIVILTDAFTEADKNAARVGSQSQSVLVKAPMNTPFIVNRGQDTQLFLLGAGPNAWNTIRINVTPAEPVNFFGSREFLDLNMVEPFLTNADSIISDHIENIIYGGLKVPASSYGLRILSKSVKNIQLNIPTLSGTLELPSTDGYSQALTTLNVSGSGLVGEWKELPNLKKLDISSVVNSDGDIMISSCPIVGGNDCIISGTDSNHLTTLNKLIMSGVEGDFRISNTNITEISFTATKDKEATFEISGDTKLQTLYLKGFKSVIIRGCPNITSLVIEDHDDAAVLCETIIIVIPKYTKPGGEEQDYLKSFGAQNLDSTYREGEFNFTKFSALKKLGLSGCKYAEVIKIPNQPVSIETFKDNENLQFIDTTGENSCIKLTMDETFSNCPYYAMRQSWVSNSGDNGKNIAIDKAVDPEHGVDHTSALTANKYTKMCISEDCTTLAKTFYKLDANTTPKYYYNNDEDKNLYTNVWGQKIINPQITVADAKWFINDVVGGGFIDDAYLTNDGIIVDSQTQGKQYGGPRQDKITSLMGCFNKQRKITYGGAKNTTLPNLSGYTSLTDISYMYYDTGVTFLSKELLSLPFSKNNNDSANKLLWDEFIRTGDRNISLDAFENISYRIEDLSSMSLTIYDSATHNTRLYTGNTKPDVRTSDIGNSVIGIDFVEVLCPHKDEHGDWMKFTRIKSISSLTVNFDQWVDYTKMFEWCTNISTINGFLTGGDLTKSRIDGLLKPCKNLTSVTESFNHIGNMDSLWGNDNPGIDLYEFFNWKDEENNTYPLAEQITQLFESNALQRTVGFAVKKHISKVHFDEIMKSLHNYTNLTKLSNIFSYCTIEDYDTNYEIKLMGDMDGVKYLDGLFYKCKAKNSYGTTVPLKIRRSLFEHLPGVISLVNTFSGVYFDHMPSYDFFCKRKSEEESIENVYYMEGGIMPQSTNAQLHTTLYKEEIVDMYNCFSGAKFSNCECWFNVSDPVNASLIPEPEYLMYNGNRYNSGTYYKIDTTITEHQILERPEIYADTFNNFTYHTNSTMIVNSSSGGQDSSQGATQIYNHDIIGDMRPYGNYGTPYVTNELNVYPTYCCLPPDIFYGCTYMCNLTNVFANTNIIGVIPKHLLKKITKANIDNMFLNTNILPNLFYHYNKHHDQAYIDSLLDDSSGLKTRYQNQRDAYLNLIKDIEVDESCFDTISYGNVIGNEPTPSDSSDAIVLFRNDNGELKRRRAIVPATGEAHTYAKYDYSKSQFVYVPQGYTSNDNLNSAFTFRYNLPGQVNLNDYALRQEGIYWKQDQTSAGEYDTSYSPEMRPNLWPYHTQFFFMVDESVLWTNVYKMQKSFITDEQDVNYVGNPRLLFSEDATYSNTWFAPQTLTDSKENWFNKTNGIMNIFLNLCGQRNTNIGSIKDYGCAISIPLHRNNMPQVGSFISGPLVAFLNGNVFDDGADYSILTTQHVSGTVIQYLYARNIIFPQINSVAAYGDASRAPKVMLSYNNQRSYVNKYMFPTDQSATIYCAIFGIDTPNSDRTKYNAPKYIIN